MPSVVRAGALNGFADLVEELGGNPRAFLARRGLPAHPDPETLVSLDATARLLEDASVELACPDFGLRLGARQHPDMLGALAVVILNARDVRSALTDVSRYLFVHSPAYEVVVDELSPLVAGCATLRFGIDLDDLSPQRQLVDGCLAMTFEFARLMGGAGARVRAVSLPHTPSARRQNYRSYFDAPVHFEQPYAGLHFDTALLNSNVREVDARLRASALDHILAINRPRATTQADVVRHALNRTMGAIRGTRTEIADVLSVHPRTLQRRLEDCGTTFDAIREDVYRTAALRYLNETDIPIAQIAGAMGYSEHAAFTRACRRWFGAPPATVRRDGLPGR